MTGNACEDDDNDTALGDDTYHCVGERDDVDDGHGVDRDNAFRDDNYYYHYFLQHLLSIHNVRFTTIVYNTPHAATQPLHSLSLLTLAGGWIALRSIIEQA